MHAVVTEVVGRETCVSRLARALELCQPLLAAAREPLRIFPVTEANAGAGAATGAPGLDEAELARCNDALAAIAASCDVVAPRFVWPVPEKPVSLEAALVRFTGLDLAGWRAVAAGVEAGELRTLADLPPPSNLPRRRELAATGALPAFATFAAGPAVDEAIVIVPPCGVPAALFRPWLAALSEHRLVLTYENPYLFGDWRARPEPAADLATEAAFVRTLVEAYGVSRAHVIGICGGAPIALEAAATLGPRAASLMVCHGDLNFGRDTPRTPFQKQFQSYLAEASASVARAREVHRMFLDPNILFGVPAQLAPYVLYPYRDLALFQRYARINHATMAYDATEAAGRLAIPLRIVTSRADRMTHAAASHQLHRTVAGSTLDERAKGSHHDILIANTAELAGIQAFVDAAAASSAATAGAAIGGAR